MADGVDIDSIEGSLTKKIGGLPGFAWVGIGLGGFLLYRKFKGGTSSATSNTSVGNTYDSAGNLVDANGNIIQYAGAANSTVSAPLGSNAAWATTAANQLQATGSYNPADIQTALANYQSGNGLTPSQQSIINAALSTFGSPPEGVIPVYSAPADTSSSIAPTLSTAAATPPPTAGGTAIPYTSAAGTVYTGGTQLSSGAISGANDSAGNKVFIPAPNAPSISLIGSPGAQRSNGKGD